MNFQPLPDPRQQLIASLGDQIDQFFAAGRTVMEIPPGASSPKLGLSLDRQQAKLRAQRDNEAPTLKYLIDQGYDRKQCAEAMGCDPKRISLMARENKLTFGGPL